MSGWCGPRRYERVGNTAGLPPGIQGPADYRCPGCALYRSIQTSLVHGGHSHARRRNARAAVQPFPAGRADRPTRSSVAPGRGAEPNGWRAWSQRPARAGFFASGDPEAFVVRDPNRAAPLTILRVARFPPGGSQSTEWRRRVRVDSRSLAEWFTSGGPRTVALRIETPHD
jgi:hypothetical protein